VFHLRVNSSSANVRHLFAISARFEEHRYRCRNSDGLVHGKLIGLNRKSKSLGRSEYRSTNKGDRDAVKRVIRMIEYKRLVNPTYVCGV
jgi:hypothetical protein